MGLGIRRRIRESRGYFALNGIDRWLAPRLNYRNGFYVELGANDGLRQSNTAYFERRRGWRGILIEPAMNRFIECMKNRSLNNFFFHTACVSFDYSSDIIWLEYGDLMTSSRLEVERAVHHMRPGEVPFRFVAPARTLSSILEEAEAPSEMDLLSLDVEGAELDVLQGLDHQRWGFKNIVVETENIPELRAHLHNHGYHFEAQITYHDYLFVKYV